MSKITQETLSALMDGENSALELRRILTSLEKDDSLGRKWNRYHIVRSVLINEMRNKDLHLYKNVDMSASFSTAIKSKPSVEIDVGTDQLEPTVTKKRWHNVGFESLANVAIAASVSALVVFGWQTAQQPDNNPGPTENPIVATGLSLQPSYPQSNYKGYLESDGGFSSAGFSNGAAVPLTRIANPQWEQQEAAHYQVDDEKRLTPYIISHSLNGALTTAPGEMPFARAVTLKH